MPARFRDVRIVLAGVVLVAVVAAILVHRDFGITWDEGVQARYGEQALAYFGSGLREQPLDNRGIMRNGVCGGLRGAAGRFETDYWVSSYREAMLWINDHVAGDAERSVTVLVGGGPALQPAAEYYAHPNVHVRHVTDAREEIALPADVDYAILTSRFGCSRFYGASPVVHEIGRDGANFTVIRARDDDS